MQFAATAPRISSISELFKVREVFVSGVREYVAGKAIELSVTKLAKWKTAVQMVSIGGLLLSQSTATILGSKADLLLDVSIAMLWAAALLTLVTGWDYLQKAIKLLQD